MRCNEQELSKIRRELHQIPEVSLKEFKTKAYLEEKLKAYGVAYQDVGDTGLMASVTGEQEGHRVLGLRCDIDGLAVYEETELDYASKHEGCMHACGHDAHMAIQLMVLKWFSENKHTFGGTIRCFNNELRKGHQSMLERICTSIAKAYRAEVKVELVPGAPVLINDSQLASRGREVAKRVLGEENVVAFQKLTASEDFAEYSMIKPSVYAFVGCRNVEAGKCFPHHNPKFDIDEKGMVVGAELAISYALDYLSHHTNLSKV